MIIAMVASAPSTATVRHVLLSSFVRMTVCPPFPLRIFLFLRAEARAGGREGPRPRPPFSFSIVAAAAQHFRSPPSHCSSRRPHSKRSRLAFKNNKRAFSTMMGMRPGIILLREGTDTSQVRHFTKKMCRRDDDREGAGGGGGGSISPLLPFFSPTVRPLSSFARANIPINPPSPHIAATPVK